MVLQISRVRDLAEVQNVGGCCFSRCSCSSNYGGEIVDELNHVTLSFPRKTIGVCCRPCCDDIAAVVGRVAQCDDELSMLSLMKDFKNNTFLPLLGEAEEKQLCESARLCCLGLDMDCTY